MSDVLFIQHQVSEGPGTILEEVKKSGHGAHLLRLDRGESVPRSAEAWGGVVVMGLSLIHI